MDDDGLYTQINPENKKRIINSEVLSSSAQQSKLSISRSDSYVTPQAIVFDLSNDLNHNTQNGSIENNEAKQKNLLDRLTIKPKLVTKKVLLTEQSHTSSEIENSESDISSKHVDNDIISKQEVNSVKSINPISSSSSALGEEKISKSETNGSFKEKSNKKVLSFFSKTNFLSLKKPKSKYTRQRDSNINNQNDTLEDQQSYDLLSNSSNNKISSSKVSIEENESKIKDSNNKNGYDEVYDDDEDIEYKENDLKKKSLKKRFFRKN